MARHNIEMLKYKMILQNIFLRTIFECIVLSRIH